MRRALLNIIGLLLIGGGLFGVAYVRQQLDNMDQVDKYIVKHTCPGCGQPNMQPEPVVRCKQCGLHYETQ